MRNILVWLVLTTVLLVCVSPYADLDDCALRSRRAASIFFWLLAAAVFMLVIRVECELRAAPIHFAAIQRHTTWLPPDRILLTDIQSFRV
jgi:hypothetical protein